MGSKNWSDVSVLLVDGDIRSRSTIRGMLAQHSITQVFDSSDGGEALNFIASDHRDLDLVVTDWNAKNIDGLELLRQVREMGGALPFLIVSDRRDYESVNQAKEEGVTYYIAKPFTSGELERKLRVMIHKELNDDAVDTDSLPSAVNESS